MSGRSRLKPHCGPTNARLRVHVGLSVPEGAGLRVGNETRAWIVGGAIAFDDSFEHEVCLSMCNEWFLLERGGVSFLQSTAETCIHVYHSTHRCGTIPMRTASSSSSTAGTPR